VKKYFIVEVVLDQTQQFPLPIIAMEKAQGIQILISSLGILSSSIEFR
jgi:hypothetical protein